METNDIEDKKLIRLLNSESQSAEFPSTSESCNSAQESERSEPDAEWTSEERKCLLQLIDEQGYVSQLLETNDDELYEKLSKLMTLTGYNRLENDIKSEWVNLLNKYNEGTEFECYEELHKILADRSGLSEIIIIQGDTCDVLDNTDHDYEGFAVCSKNKKTKKWNDKETFCLIEALECYGLPTRRALSKISRLVHKHMKVQGFNRTLEQIQFRLKNLKSRYYRVQRNEMNEASFPFYRQIKHLFDEYKKTLNEEQLQKFLVVHEMNDNAQKASEDDGDDTEAVDAAGVRPLVRTGKRSLWSEEETQTLLQFMKKKRLVTGNVLTFQMSHLTSTVIQLFLCHIPIVCQSCCNCLTVLFHLFDCDISIVLFTGRQLLKHSSEAVEFMVKHGYNRTPAQMKTRYNNCRTRYWGTTNQSESDSPSFSQLQTVANEGNIRIFDVNNQETCDSNNVDNESYAFEKTMSSSAKLCDAATNTVARKPEEKSCDCTCRDTDSIDYYCLSLAKDIRKFDIRKQAKLKIEMMQLMYKAEYDPDF